MKYLDLREKIKTNIFDIKEVFNIFSSENELNTKIQLARLTKKGLIFRIKKGLYCFKKEYIEEFILANILYQPSYISLETALSYYGLIPDVPQNVTSVTTITTKKLENEFGVFQFAKVSPELYFGFKAVLSAKEGRYFWIAEMEKALLDYFYIRKIKKIDSLRLNLKEINVFKYKEYKKYFPSWVKRIL